MINIYNYSREDFIKKFSEIAHIDTIVYSTMDAYRAGFFHNQEEALMACVVALVEFNQEIKDTYTKLLQNSTIHSIDKELATQLVLGWRKHALDGARK